MSNSQTSQLFSIGLVLVLVQVAKRLDLENPDNLQYLRMAYATSQVIVFSGLYYIYTQIEARNDQTELKYEDKKPMSQTPPEEIVTTVKAYDIEQLKKQLQSSVLGVAFLIFLHFKWNYIQPLFLQSILTIKGLLESNLAKIYVFGKEATGPLKRPFAVQSMFNMPQSEEPTTSAPTLQPSGVVELPSDDESEVTDKKNKKQGSKNKATTSSSN